MMSKGKIYGLIIPKKESKTTATRPSVFGDESDEDEPAVQAKVVQKIGTESVLKRQTQLEIDKALAEDPSVYEYDDVYDKIQEERKAKIPGAKKDKDRKPKYIQNLLKTAELRKKEQERRTERQVQKERENEQGEFDDKETFVTGAYRKKMQEMAEEEEKERRQKMIDAKMDVTNQKDLSGFYRNLLNQTTEGPEDVKTKVKQENEGPKVTHEQPSRKKEVIDFSLDKDDSGSDSGSSSDSSSSSDSNSEPKKEDAHRQQKRQSTSRDTDQSARSEKDSNRYRNSDTKRDRDSEKVSSRHNEMYRDPWERGSTSSKDRLRYSDDGRLDRSDREPERRRSDDGRLGRSDHEPERHRSDRHDERSRDRREKGNDTRDKDRHSDRDRTERPKDKDARDIHRHSDRDRTERPKDKDRTDSYKYKDDRSRDKDRGDRYRDKRERSPDRDRQRDKDRKRDVDRDDAHQHKKYSLPSPKRKEKEDPLESRAKELAAKFTKRNVGDSVNDAKARYLARKQARHVPVVQEEEEEDG